VHIKAPNLLLQKYEKAQEKKRKKKKEKRKKKNKISFPWPQKFPLIYLELFKKKASQHPIEKKTMASVSSPLHPPVFSLSPPPPAAKCKLPSKVHTVQRTSPSPHETRTGRDSSYTHHRQRSVVLRSALDEIYVLDPPPSSPYEEGKTEPIASLKLKLLVIVIYLFFFFFI
jgi:hypothetical protein